MTLDLFITNISRRCFCWHCQHFILPTSIYGV